jgi:hypothetical protein
LAPNDPQLALTLGANNFDELNHSSSEENGWPYASRYDELPFKFKPSTTNPHPNQSRCSKAKKTRLGLPITLNPKGIAAATVLACADTGADVNIISEDLAQALGYTEYETIFGRKQFRLANGKIVESIGQVYSPCAFGTGPDSAVSISCIFHVLTKVVTPIIMGMQFLQETETMTKYRERLVRVPRPALQALSVCSLDKPRQLLGCNLNGKPAVATPDTGSEIDLMSPQAAAELGMSVQPGEEVIELADGTFDTTCGYVRTVVSIDNPVSESPSSLNICTSVQFHLLRGLTHNVLIGDETLEELRVFTDNQHSLISVPIDDNSLEIKGIRSHGPADKLRSWLGSMFRSQLPVSNNTGMITI